MAYGTPDGVPSSSSWQITVRDTSASPEPVTLAFTGVHNPELDLGDTEALFQKVVTVLDGHGDLQVTTARRVYPTSQDVTP